MNGALNITHRLKATFIVALLLSCSESTNPTDSTEDGESGGATSPSTGGSATQGDGGGGGTAGTATGSGGEVDSSSGGEGNRSGGGSGGAPVDTPFVYDPNLDVPRVTCAEQRVTAEPLPLDIYAVLDRTGSMRSGASSIDTSDCDVTLDSAPSSTSKWCWAVNALGKYFTSSMASGHRAALQFMTPGDQLSGNACLSGSENPHSQPAVEFTLLPEQAGAAGGLIEAMNLAVPDGQGTEIESAFHGIADFTSQNKSTMRRMIGLLVTDGNPAGDCSTDIPSLSEIAADHLAETGIPTFIIGMTGAHYDLLEQLARGGGSPEQNQFCDPDDPNPTCHYWSVGDGDPTTFVAALSAIQESVVGCEYSVPMPGEGLIDLDTVSVEFTADATTSPVVLKRAADLGACAEDSYYTAELGGTATIKLCPTTCAQVSNASAIDVEIQCSGT